MGDWDKAQPKHRCGTLYQNRCDWNYDGAQLGDGILLPRLDEILLPGDGGRRKMETICSACSTEYRILISRQTSWVRSGRQVRLLRELRGITEDTTFVHRQDHAV